MRGGRIKGAHRDQTSLSAAPGVHFIHNPTRPQASTCASPGGIKKMIGPFAYFWRWGVTLSAVGCVWRKRHLSFHQRTQTTILVPNASISTRWKNKKYVSSDSLTCTVFEILERMSWIIIPRASHHQSILDGLCGFETKGAIFYKVQNIQ